MIFLKETGNISGTLDRQIYENGKTPRRRKRLTTDMLITILSDEINHAIIKEMIIEKLLHVVERNGVQVIQWQLNNMVRTIYNASFSIFSLT